MTEQLLQYLSPEGTVSKDSSTMLDEAQHRTIFETMLKVRLFEERAMKLQRQGRIGFYIGAYGQEASHVASGFAFESQDWMFPAYRQLGIMIQRGVPLQDIVNQLYGNSADLSKGRQMPCHHSFKEFNWVSISSPIGTQIPQAVGTAMAAKYRGDDVVVGTYMGDGGTSEGDFHVALNFAGVYNAPVVFIVENNQWAISCHSSRQTASSSYAIKAKAYGFDGILVDGNDVLAVYEATKNAVDKARSGGGPTLIESYTYRLFSHSSSDDADRYRPKDEYEEALKKEPLARYRKYLESLGIWTQEWEDKTGETFKAELSAAIEKSETFGRPDERSMFEDVYADTHPVLEEQWRIIEDELKDRESWDEEGEFPL